LSEIGISPGRWLSAKLAEQPTIWLRVPAQVLHDSRRESGLIPSWALTSHVLAAAPEDSLETVDMLNHFLADRRGGCPVLCVLGSASAYVQATAGVSPGLDAWLTK
jgi:hypothetical protein